MHMTPVAGATERAVLPRLRSEGTLLLDAAGRQVMLRGINLGGDSKLPYPDGGTDRPGDFADHREVSFIGRPFPLDEADTHFARLRHWGFNSLRLLTTWEAVEHAGPGLYDRDYLDYLAEVARRAGEHGLYVLIDFHQDAWSRMSGGSGAPGWTFEAVGLDFRRFAAADAAIVMQAAYDYSSPEPHQAAYPPMVWSRNYLAPANGIMWTLFWGGRFVTPALSIEGRNVQDFLQQRLLGAMSQVALRMRGLNHVIGFDSLNEPSPGWIEARLSRRRLDPRDPGLLPIKPGPAWSPLDALAAAQGLSVWLPLLRRDPASGRIEVEGTRQMNPQGVRIWRDDVDCPFEAAGIYSMVKGAARAERERAFMLAGERRFSMTRDAYAPWFAQVAATVRRQRADWLLFAELDPYALLAGRGFPEEMPAGSVHAGHWYDLAILYGKSCVQEPRRAERYRRELGWLTQASSAFGGPTLLGEFGIPFDLHQGRAYRAWAVGERETAWADHVDALGQMFDAIDELGLHAMLWNYTASNRNDPRIGDGWNQEDLSVFSADQIGEPADPDAGGRAVRGFCRPHVRCAQGRILRVVFEPASHCFSAELEADPAADAPTELYLPRLHFPDGLHLSLEGPGSEEAAARSEGQILYITHRHAGRCVVRVRAAD